MSRMYKLRAYSRKIFHLCSTLDYTMEIFVIVLESGTMISGSRKQFDSSGNITTSEEPVSKAL